MYSIARPRKRPSACPGQPVVACSSAVAAVVAAVAVALELVAVVADAAVAAADIGSTFAAERH